MIKYESLFAPLRIGRHTLKNRVVSAPVTTHFGPTSGDLNDQLITYWVERARGGAGLIITDGISPNSKVGNGVKVSASSLDSHYHAVKYSDLAEKVHVYGSKIIIQLEVSGLSYTRDPIEEGIDLCLSYSKEDINDIIEAQVAASVYLQMAGIDGVQVQCSGGYFMSQFISPLTNKRTDEYNGNLEARAKIATDTIQAIRQACGPNFLIDVRFPVLDYVEGGLTVEDGIQLAKMLEKAGADMLNVHIGLNYEDEIFATDFRPEANRLEHAEAIKPHVNIPIILNGKIKTPEVANKVLAEGKADLIAMGRPLLADANWANKALMGQTDKIRPCLSCNECFNRVVKANTIRCTMNPYLGYEGAIDELNIQKSSNKKNVVVVGGGVAGMTAATTAAKRGHNVTLLEKKDHLGGQLNLASVPPHKESIKKAEKWLENELLQSGVSVKLNVSADLEKIKEYNPDFVIVANGAEPNRIPVKGIENTVQSWDVLKGDMELSGKKVVVIGGGIVGCETALYIAEKGNNVTILEMMPQLANGLEYYHAVLLPQHLEEAGIKAYTSVITKEISNNNVIYQTQDNEEHVIEADIIVTATGQRPIGSELTMQIMEQGIPAISIGDASSTGKIMDAVRSGFNIALDL